MFGLAIKFLLLKSTMSWLAVKFHLTSVLTLEAWERVAIFSLGTSKVKNQCLCALAHSKGVALDKKVSCNL